MTACPSAPHKRVYKTLSLQTSNNQRLRSAGDNDRKSKRFCSIAVLCPSFTWQSQNMRDQITSDKGSQRAWSNCVLCIPFILSGSPNECWLHTCDACVIKTSILGLHSPLVARNNVISRNEHNGQLLALRSLLSKSSIWIKSEIKKWWNIYLSLERA